jgi:hypothetical protein
MLLLVYLPSI